MKKVIRANSQVDKTYRIYLEDGNQKLAGGPGATLVDAIEYVLATDSRYTAADIYKVEEAEEYRKP